MNIVHALICRDTKKYHVVTTLWGRSAMSTWTFRIVKKKNCWTCPKYKGSNFYYLKTFLHPFFNESAMFFPIQICMFKFFLFFLVDHLRQYGNSLYQNWLKVEQVYVGDLFSTYHLKMHYDSTLSAGLTKYIHSSRNDQG